LTLNIVELWDFSDPAESEKRFRSALETASSEEALILKTQIARTYGLRRDFDQARQILAEIEPQMEDAIAEVRVRYWLELGRTLSSATATHSNESQTVDAKEQARSAYMRAFELAKEGQLDYLAIDALHMMAFIDTGPKDQLEWDKKALDVMQASTQPEAKKWAASLHNNIGYALHQLGRYEEALAAFKEALSLREQSGTAGQIRVAHWMMAWTLRFMGQLDEALEIQLRLEKECDEAGEPDPYVFEELEHIYKALNDSEKAAYYSDRRNATNG